MEAKLKLTLNQKEAKNLVGILGEQNAQAVEKESVSTGLRAIGRKLKSVMPKVRNSHS